MIFHPCQLRDRGCPIIQGGKLIGAVTYVLVDPTTGYGIYVENMLEAAAQRRAEMVLCAADLKS